MTKNKKIFYGALVGTVIVLAGGVSFWIFRGEEEIPSTTDKQSMSQEKQ